MILGISVLDVEVSKDVEDMARSYLDQLGKDKTNQAQMAELAWAFRRQLQTDLKRVEGGEDERKKLLRENETHAFSLAVYRRLLPLSGKTIERELVRHEQEKNAINGTYEEFKSLKKHLTDERTSLHALLAEMFKRAGQELNPVHLAKRTVLESHLSELEEKLTTVKEKNPDVAALIEYDTIKDYATQLRETGFIWTASRQKLLGNVMTAALTGRPLVMLMGETGSGKTAIARVAALKLSGREPERTVGGNQEKFARLLASPAIQEGKTYYEFGPLLRAMTGKSSSIDEAPGYGGGFFFDDEFNTRPTSVQREIIKFVSEARPGRKVTIPGTPLTVMVEPGFLYLAAGNPPSERYDREETGIETKREFAGNVLNVEYLEQTPDNPELYQVLLASLIDSSTGRLTAVTPEEVQPAWLKDKATGESSLDLDPTHGAFLWRFSQAWGELFKAFSHKDTILHKAHPADAKAKWHLPSFILDPGVVISWIDQYKASPKARKGHVADFLERKLSDYILQFPEDEQKTVDKYLKHFALVQNIGGKPKGTKATKETTKPPSRVLTPRDIGYLNPNVSRPKEKGEPPKATGVDVIDPETGDVIGVTEFPEPPAPEIPPPREPGELAPFTYDAVKAKEYGFSEMKIEAHEKAQQLIDAIYAQDPAFVTIHKVGDPDPDSTSTPKVLLAVEKIKANLDAIKLYWQQHCPDLPNTPEKSNWFFQALAEHRLSNTVDADNKTTITSPTQPHIPAFAQAEFLLTMDWKEFDYNNTTEKQAAVTPQTKVICQKLFGTTDVVNLSRNVINEKLWKDHEKRIHAPQALAVIQELLGTGQDPNDFELRLMRYDEYSRAASSQGYGAKNLWTHMDGYYAHGDGHRHGLGGGRRGRGGAARVDGGHRGVRGEGLAVRLVLSRKS